MGARMIDLIVTLLRFLLIRTAEHAGVGIPVVAAFLIARILVPAGRSAK